MGQMDPTSLGYLAQMLGMGGMIPPARPTSRGAMLGAGYQAMPDMTASIEDQRQADLNAALMAKASGVLGGDFLPSALGGPQSLTSARGYDPMLDAALQMESTVDYSPTDVSPYSPSYKTTWKPPRPTEAAYRPSPTGPDLPPPQWTHLPISPSDPGWTPPPSPSGPHNRAGDPSRPGYDRNVFPTDQ